MGPARGGGQCLVQEALGLEHPRAGGRLPGRRVPQGPGGDVEQRVGGQGLHVDIGRIGGGQLCHCVGVGAQAGAQRLRVVGVVGREAGLQRRDQALVDRTGPSLGGQGQLHACAGQ